MSFLRALLPTPTPQRVRSNIDEVRNNDGGFVYEIDLWARLDRFLTIGSEGGTYYVTQRELTDDNSRALSEAIRTNAARVVARIVEISREGRGAKQDYGVFALALCASSPLPESRAAAYGALPVVCRTASTLFMFLSYVKNRRGWSRGLRSAVARWYEERPVDQLAYQMVKYQNRHGFTHRDALRLAHADPNGDATRNALFAWSVGKAADTELPAIVLDFEAAKAADASRSLARMLPREALPTEWLGDAEVWEALLYGDGPENGMPMTAMVRNLASMTRAGLLTADSSATAHVVAQLGNTARVQAARLHPIALYLAAKVYALGRGVRGSGSWAPVGAIVDALESAFLRALESIEPSGKRLVIAVDSSASMQSHVLGMPVTAREISMASAFTMMRTEPEARLIGFTDGSNTTEFKVARDERLRDLIHRFEATVEGRGTDCAIALTWPRAAKFKPDGVVIFTDSETWAGKQKVMEALADLRRYSGRATKIVTVATTATPYDIVDPNDPLAFGIAGFDAAAPQLIAGFLR